jgi:hypothetical protein
LIYGLYGVRQPRSQEPIGQVNPYVYPVYLGLWFGNDGSGNIIGTSFDTNQEAINEGSPPNLLQEDRGKKMDTASSERYG